MERSEGRSEGGEGVGGVRGGEGVERSEGVCSPHTRYQRPQTPGRLQTRETTRKRQSAVPWLLRRSSKRGAASFNRELGPVLAAAGLLAGYAVLLEQTGFLLATAAATAIAVGPILKIWRWRLIAGMSLGLSLGVYLILGKALGVYLPYGKLVNLAF